MELTLFDEHIAYRSIRFQANDIEWVTRNSTDSPQGDRYVSFLVSFNRGDRNSSYFLTFRRINSNSPTNSVE
jgi:hypothetical protein